MNVIINTKSFIRLMAPIIATRGRNFNTTPYTLRQRQKTTMVNYTLDITFISEMP